MPMAPKVNSSTNGDKCRSRNGQGCLSIEDLLARIERLEQENDDLRAQIHCQHLNPVVSNPAREESVDHNLCDVVCDQKHFRAPEPPLRRRTENYSNGVRVKSRKPACNLTRSLVEIAQQDANSISDESLQQISFSLGKKKKNRYSALSSSMIKMMTAKIVDETHCSSPQNANGNTPMSGVSYELLSNDEPKETTETTTLQTAPEKDISATVNGVEGKESNQMQSIHLSTMKNNRRTLFQNCDLANQWRKRQTVMTTHPSTVVPIDEIKKNDVRSDDDDDAYPLESNTDHCSFDEFMLFSKDLHASIDQIDIREGRNRFLDPFTLVDIDCIDRYLPEICRDTLDPVEVVNFCCPEGIKARIVPRAAIDGAKRLGWTGRASYNYKILVVSDKWKFLLFRRFYCLLVCVLRYLNLYMTVYPWGRIDYKWCCHFSTRRNSVP